jgi:adenylate cyclase
MGIGINTGEVVVGNIGSERRAAYGAVGSPINIAYRIEAFTVGGQILISPSTYEKVQSDVKVTGTRQVQFKGIDHPVNLYDVVGLSGAYHVDVPEKKAETLTRLDPPLPIDCYSLEGKVISEAAISGQIIRLGETVAEASLAQRVKPHSNLRILVAPQEKNDLSEVYAKVLPPEALGQTASEKLVVLQFTWLPEEVKIFLSKRHSGK